MFPRQGAWVPSLAGELRFHMPLSVATKEKKLVVRKTGSVCILWSNYKPLFPWALLPTTSSKSTSEVPGSPMSLHAYKSPLLQFSCSVVSDSLWPHEPQYTRPPCLSPTPRVYPNSCPLSQWCYLTIVTEAKAMGARWSLNSETREKRRSRRRIFAGFFFFFQKCKASIGKLKCSFLHRELGRKTDATERQSSWLQVLYSEETLQSRASSAFQKRQVAVDLHRGLGRVDGSRLIGTRWGRRWLALSLHSSVSC